jgi:beta-1,4-mannosyl-glycoprotein beta-1,4-N-acetylglucosaminyltransferase
MVYDTFMLADELDMLECRLTEFEEFPYPVVHVVAESRVTHRGDPKPLSLTENMDRFGVWRDRIRYIVADTLPGPGAWDREHQQREYVRHALGSASPGDVILHGDLDEIPRMSALEEAVRLLDAHPGSGWTLRMRVHQYAVDWLSDFEELATVAVKASMLPALFIHLRDMKNLFPQIPDGGWHLSSIGDHAAVMRKLGRHCHLEQTAEEYERAASGLSYRTGLSHGGTQQVPVEVDETWPRYVTERRCPPFWFRPREAACSPSS